MLHTICGIISTHRRLLESRDSALCLIFITKGLGYLADIKQLSYHQCRLNFLFSAILRLCRAVCWNSWASPEGLSFFICKIWVLDDITSRFPFSSWTPLFGFPNKPAVFLSGSVVKSPPAVQETQIRSLGREDPLEKEMATHSSTLAWRIPWTEEPGRLQSMGLQRVRHDCVTHFNNFDPETSLRCVVLIQSTGQCVLF